MATSDLCSVCKNRGGCPGCAGAGASNGKRCLICRGNGDCPVCHRRFDAATAAAQPVSVAAAPRMHPTHIRSDLPTVRASPSPSGRYIDASADAPVSVKRWSSGYLTARALVALAVLVAFYVFALAVAAGLLFITWFQVAVLSQQKGSVTVLGLLVIPPIAALGIILAILPRGARSGYPGRGIDPKRAPELFAFISDVARHTRQRMPRAVYLVPEANAYFGARGPFLGKAIALGLPLFEGLSVDELRAIVAHEFGHSKNGMGPITRTVYRSTRTFIVASAAAGAVPFLDGVFELWTELYLRLSMPIARQYELRCDELACQVAGTEATISALTRISNMDGESEIANPVAGWEEDLHSTHPPLRDRVAQARALSLPGRNAEPDARPARVLLESLIADATARAAERRSGT